MKHAFGLLFVGVSLALGLQARCTTLPDACGDNKTQFDVKTLKNQPAPAPPAAGKAQIVFVEEENQWVAPFTNATVRFGMDGAWVGANEGNSYFTIDVAPGTHHLCASWQGTKNLGLAPITAEPGKVYYFAARVNVESKYSVAFDFSPLNDDEGKYRVKAGKLSTSKPKPQD